MENFSLTSEVEKCMAAGNDLMFSGLSGSARWWMIKQLLQFGNQRLLILLPEEEAAVDWCRELKKFTGMTANRFPGRDFIFMKENSAQNEMERLHCLQLLLDNPQHSWIMVATAGSLMYRIKAPDNFRQESISLQPGQRFPRGELIEALIKADYERVDTAVRPGHVAVRGSVIDVFPVGDDEGLRIDFFDDEIDSIRRFNADDQRSSGVAGQVSISPADEIDGYGRSGLLDYLPPNTLVWMDEPREFYKNLERQLRRYEGSLREARREGKELRELALWRSEELRQALTQQQMVYHSFFSGNIAQAQVGYFQHISQTEMESFQGREQDLWQRLRRWQQDEWRIVMALDSRKQQQQLQQQLIDEHISGIEFIEAGVKQGFASPTLRLALLTSRDIWGKIGGKTARRRQKSEGERVFLEELHLGDYVVHENYGIGIFRGITQVETDGITREYLLLQYAGTDKLYLPVEKLDLLYRYASSGEREPRLHKLGGSEWERTRNKVKQSIEELAQELLELYARRENAVGYAFSPDTPWQGQFEADFPFQETPDQLQAIEEVKRDMESSRPMDRLLCGDVGYGKTEVALRAAFKAVMDGKQVAVLVPTTVLAEQHGETFRQRMASFPVSVEVLSRFRSRAQQKKITEDLKKGSLDIVIATHRLLSKDIEIYDLGLLIVDEEHRFGVVQKERIKSLKAKVDVISLSATPIPRSLHMSMTGLRDFSVIETPPPERYPISTYVLEYNPEIIREAIQDEIARGGQVFFVHNRVQDIYRVQTELQELLPGVRMAVGHGQMNEEELAQVLIEFNSGAHDVLLCTTIIESGLDMPNVNTIIIDMADRLGLAQLYQLRGRVGRSNRIASAFLCYRPDRALNEEAQKRLNAIREFNELGAGLKIALRDLEIRGAGNILGGEQHGHIYAVGFDLYCRMLQEHAAGLRGEEVEKVIQPQLDIDADYYIPDHYITDPGTRMRLYKQVLQANDEAELNEAQEEVLDRFGPIPEPVDNFIKIARIRLLARQHEIKSFQRRGREIEIETVKPLYQHKMQLKNGGKMRLLNANTVRLVPDDAGLDSLLTLFRNM